MKTMMKNSNLMTRVALTLLVMMLTATTAWATTMTMKYTFGSYTEKDNGKYEVNVSATGVSTTGDVNKNYSVTITEQNNGREASFAFSEVADITLAWSSTEAFFYLNSSNSSKSYFGAGDSSKYWTLTIGSANYYITKVNLYNYEDQKIYETDNNSKSCDLYLRNNDMYISSTSLAAKTTHAIEVTLSDTPPVYNINYELNGGTNASSNPSTYTGGTGVASFANPTRTGYSFGGWYDDSSFSTAITSISTSATGKVTLYAKWTANTYTVVYNANGGSGSMSDQSFTYDGQQNLSANTFTYPGKLFNGWNTAADGSGTSYSDGQSVPNLTATNGARVTLYAQWKLDPNIYPTGSGTSSDPYVIKNINHWNTFANANNHEAFYRSGTYIKLDADISGVTTTVGTQEHPFKGTFNGNNKTLTVNINETSTQGTALFREISGATIKNLSVAGSVTGTTHAAALVGFSRSGTNTIEDCNVSANVTVNTGNNKHCGGLVGHAVKSTLTIQNCIYSGTINNGGNYAGGLQGWSDGGSTLTIENSLFSGSYAGSGLFHPIAVRYRNASMTSNINGAYYTAAPTLTDAEYIVTPGTQAYTSQQSFPCKKATILGTTIYYAADLTPFGKTDSYSPDGSAQRPFIISDTGGWNYFCDALLDNDTWNRFSGKTVKLGADITVTRMAGSSDHEFCGTFDGDHHTLTVQYGTADAPIEQQQFVAPFVETARNTSPVFRNLTIDGNIYVKYADSSVEPGVGGLIGHLFGNVTVEHCTSNVVINSDKDRAGGFVGLCEYAVTFTDCKSSADITCTGSGGGFVGWSRASDYTIAFEGCLFDGKLLKKDGVGEGNGGFVGWKGNTKTVNINNCLVALDDVKAMATYHSSTFARNNNYPPNITNSYYTTAFGADQGTQPRSIVAGENVTINHIEPTGSATNYTISGITAYSGGGIKYGDKFYYGKDDVVSLSLSHEDQEGYAFLGYEAKDSLQNTFALTPAGDNYTLTMPDDDVTVTANVVEAYSLTLPDGMEVVEADHEAIDGKYPVGTIIQFKIKSNYVLEGDVKNGDTVLTADGGIYTVTVGNADIVITASVVEKTYSLTLPDGMVVWSAEPAAIDGKYPVGTIIQFKIKSDYVLDGDVKNGDKVLTADEEGYYTVTVGNADIVITATVVEAYSLTLPDGMEVVSATPAAIDGKYPVGTIIQFKIKSEDYVLEGDVMNGDEVLEANAQGIYTVTVGNADIMITVIITLTGGNYTAKNCDELTGSTDGTVTIADGASITLSDVTINGGIVCEGTATIILVGENSVTGSYKKAGIQVGGEGTTLTIKGNGALTATGSWDCAGIGTNVYNDSVTLGNIIIEGGSITANGGDGGAGIGTGEVYTRSGIVTLGNIIIEGGSITANGGDFGAGIGTGFVAGGTAKLGNIIIEGGIITATGGRNGAGIGTGHVDQGNVTLGNITIEGGSITATGGRNGAGIGTGFVDGGGIVTFSDITIEGGSITATGGYLGAGIGTGYVGTGVTATLGTLTIYDDIDRVDATGNYKWGISEDVVYKHGESNVTGNASDYFDINDEGEHVVIESIQNKKYTITLVNEEKHGTVTVVAKAMSGESVTITVTPDSGYMLDTIEVKDANGNEVSLKDMSFTMPDSNVTITVTWKYVGVKGDVNRDGNVDISDVVALVNIILNSSSDHQAEADLNNDGDIDISDVVALVNIILGQ